LLRDSRNIIRRLEREGFELVSVAGSHRKYVNRNLRRRVIVPHRSAICRWGLLAPYIWTQVGKGLIEQEI
jgi:predicted RNA binding protein YcfA (HicA-like mRNA interferase family)